MCIRFPIHADIEGNGGVREIGRVARGVTGIRFKVGDDYVVGADVIAHEKEELLTVSERGLGKRTEVDEYRLQARGGKGVIAMKLTPKTGKIVGVVIVDDEMDLMALTSTGKMIRCDMESLRKAGRNTSGVKVVTLDEGDKVVSIARCPREPQEEDEIADDEAESTILE
jgi:DNA gyrase subunit A